MLSWFSLLPISPQTLFSPLPPLPLPSLTQTKSFSSSSSFISPVSTFPFCPCQPISFSSNPPTFKPPLNLPKSRLTLCSPPFTEISPVKHWYYPHLTATPEMSCQWWVCMSYPHISTHLNVQFQFKHKKNMEANTRHLRKSWNITKEVLCLAEIEKIYIKNMW